MLKRQGGRVALLGVNLLQDSFEKEAENHFIQLQHPFRITRSGLTGIKCERNVLIIVNGTYN